MPKMLTVDERFESIVADMVREERADKMVPFEEPKPGTKPSEGTPLERKPVEQKPVEEKPSEGN